jgi:autotransporter-associated beta strand protein
MSSSQVQNFVNHCHAHGQKAGVYWTPFVYWGTIAQSSNSAAPGSAYLYSDLLLRTTTGGAITNDGGLALDPTHPGTQALINYQIGEFTNWGFDYVKLDFLTHGALEGVHYNPNVTTGIEAYNGGMQQLLSAINGRMFISESIAPIFPYQYGHSRRIACDAETSEIGNTAYTMNSVSCGWWLSGRLYQFNDPDAMVFDNGPNTNEDQSRLINGVVTGLFLNGSILTNATSISLAQMCLTNAAINGVARAGLAFRPVDGATGTGAASIWAGQNGTNWCIAVFNYTAGTTNQTVNLASAGLPPGYYVGTNLWNGTTTVISGSFTVSLNAKQAKLFQLTPRPPANLQWSSLSNTGIWDTGISLNWINEATAQPSVFNADDDVLLDDTPGVPTTVSISGTVTPGTITVNASANNYIFTGAGAISGGSLSKTGTGTLTLDVPGNFTGPVAISGGTVTTALGNAFTTALSITITNGATLNNAFNLNSIPVVVSGAGVGGNGAIVNNSGTALYDSSGGLAATVTLAGNTTFGGTTRWDLGRRGTTGTVLSTSGNPYTLTITGTSGLYFEWDNLALDTNLAGITILPGISLGVIGASTLGNPAGTLTVSSNAALVFYNDGSASPLVNKQLQLQNGATVQNGGGTTAVVSPVILGTNSGDNGTFGIGGTSLAISNVMSGPGNLDKTGSSPLYLSAANTYTGNTIISAGTLALTGYGAISGSAAIIISNTAIVDVSGRTDQTLTLAAGQTVSGLGTINGALIVSPGATVAPGTGNTGTLTVTNGISLKGITLLKLNGSGANDVLQTGGAIAYGGTLSLTNISATPWVAGNSFHLFTAASYTGAFTKITPAIPEVNLAWNTNSLSSGVLTIVAKPTRPPGFGGLTSSGNGLVFHGTNGVPDWPYYVLAGTNLASPLTSWARVATNYFDAGGNFAFTNAINSQPSQLFYLLQLQ